MCANQASKFHFSHVTYCIRSFYCASSNATAWSVWSVTFVMSFLYIPHPFLYHIFVHLVSITYSSCYNKNYFTGLVHVHSIVMYCSLAKSGRLICIAKSWEFHFVMLTSVRAKQFGSSGKTSLDLSSRIGCWAYGGRLCCYTTRTAAGKLPLIVTSCIISV